MNKKIIIAGGGTGGHIFPAVAIANALRRLAPDTDILFIGAKGKMEMEKVPEAGYRIEGIDIAGFNRSSLLKNITLPLKIMRSFVRVSELFKQFRPDAAVGVGGYSTFPVLRYAQSKGIPTFIHEANSFAGKTNILLAKKASRIFTGGDGMEKFFPAEKIMVTGNPIRKSILHTTVMRNEAIRSFGLDPTRKTILVTGGSLGAASINEAVSRSIELFSVNDLQVIWQTGKPFYESAKQYAQSRLNVKVFDFISKMENAFAAADIVVSRSGAMAIAELSVVKKPAIFVPYPFAAEDHQTVNAQRLVDKHAGVMVTDTEAGEKLLPAIVRLAEDEEKRAALRTNIGKLAVTDADEIVAKEIMKTIND